MDVTNSYHFTIAHPETFKQLGTKDLLFATYQCPQVDKFIKLLTHLNEIAFTLDGKKIIHQGGKSWNMTQDKALFVRKTAFTQEIVPDMRGWEVLAFYFPDDFLRKVYQENRSYLPIGNLPTVPVDMLTEIHVNDTTRAFFYGIVPYFTQKIPPSENLLELKFKELLCNILSNPANAGLLAYARSLEGQNATPIWQVMETNFMYNLSLAQFAQLTGRSVSAFKREFKEYYQSTPGRWLTQKRLNYARLLLETSNRSVSEIVFDSGFENLSHLSRIFKERYGVSPQQYRNQLN